MLYPFEGAISGNNPQDKGDIVLQKVLPWSGDIIRLYKKQTKEIMGPTEYVVNTYVLALHRKSTLEDDILFEKRLMYVEGHRFREYLDGELELWHVAISKNVAYILYTADGFVKADILEKKSEPGQWVPAVSIDISKNLEAKVAIGGQLVLGHGGAFALLSYANRTAELWWLERKQPRMLRRINLYEERDGKSGKATGKSDVEGKTEPPHPNWPRGVHKVASGLKTDWFVPFLIVVAIMIAGVVVFLLLRRKKVGQV